MKMRSNSFPELVQSIDWIAIEPHGGGAHRLKPDSVAVRYAESKPKSGNVDRIAVRIGEGIIKKMQWKVGDRICFYVNPDDMKHYMLIKSDRNIGYKLAMEPGGLNCNLNIKWNKADFNNFALEKMTARDVEFEIRDKYLSLLVR